MTLSLSNFPPVQYTYQAGDSTLIQQLFYFTFMSSLFVSLLQDHPRAEYEFKVMQKSMCKDQKAPHKVITYRLCIFVSLELYVLIKGRGGHTLLKPYETNCDL